MNSFFKYPTKTMKIESQNLDFWKKGDFWIFKKFTFSQYPTKTMKIESQNQDFWKKGDFLIFQNFTFSQYPTKTMKIESQIQDFWEKRSRRLLKNFYPRPHRGTNAAAKTTAFWKMLHKISDSVPRRIKMDYYKRGILSLRCVCPRQFCVHFHKSC